MEMDQIKIKDLEIFAHHGVYAEETTLGQKFLVTAVLHLDARKAGREDELTCSINYGTIAHLIKKEMQEHTFLLIEAAAEHLAEHILLFDEKIEAVEIEVKKPWAPIGLPLDTVSVSVKRSWHEAYIAFGSNIGDKEVYIKKAIEGLKATPGCKVEKISELIVTEPYGGVEQDMFLNGTLKLRTLLTPKELLRRLHELEQEAGRERKVHWGPRTLDLDILLYDKLLLEEDDLCIPHVDMQNREFVLKPMAEIAPYKRHPVYGKTMKEMYQDLNRK